jgi:hypothetical protein
LYAEQEIEYLRIENEMIKCLLINDPISINISKRDEKNNRALRDHLCGVTEKLETCTKRPVQTSNGISCKLYVELLSCAAMHYVDINFAGKEDMCAQVQ